MPLNLFTSQCSIHLTIEQVDPLGVCNSGVQGHHIPKHFVYLHLGKNCCVNVSGNIYTEVVLEKDIIHNCHTIIYLDLIAHFTYMYRPPSLEVVKHSHVRLWCICVKLHKLNCTNDSKIAVGEAGTQLRRPKYG